MGDTRYDAVFIGNSLTALTAAVVLAKEGHAVLLLGGNGEADRNLPDPSFDFSTGPLLYFGYEHGGAVEGLFSKLAFPIPNLQQKGLRFKKVSPMLQIVQSSHRINLYSDEHAYLDELKREYGDQARKLKIFFDQIEREAAAFYPFIGQFQQLEIARVSERFREWRKQLDFSQAVRAQRHSKAADLLSQYAFSSDLREYFNLLSLFAFKKPLSGLNAFDFIRLLSGLQKGGVRMTGGYPTLVSFFQRLIQTWGGTVFFGEKISKIERQGKALNRLILTNGASVIGSQFILSKPSDASAIHFYFRIPHKLLPLPMKESLLMTWGDDPPPQVKDILIVRLNLEDEASDGSADVRRIAVSTFPQENQKVSMTDYKTLEKKVLERLHWLIPFSESKIQSVPQSPPQDSALRGAYDIFSQIKCGAQTKGTKKALLKGIAHCLRPKGEKNLLVIESDQADRVGWASSLVAGMRLASLIEGPKK